MINEVDETLRNVFRTEVVNDTDVDVVFDAPTREWASRRNKPTLDLYLYDIREDLRRRESGMLEKRDEEGKVISRQQLPRFFKLAYLVTAWTQRPEDEHRLLSACLAAIMRYTNIPTEFMTPLLLESEMPLMVQIAFPPPENRQVSDVWSSLGGDLKPSIDLVITMPILPDSFMDVAKVVMAPLRLRTYGHTTSDGEDGTRALRNGRQVPAGTGDTAS
ncbi:MAG TPA: DUF4255 domain-containing protein [Acidimicrobiales bacterium]|jgi:hypothetical protein|nr:DUF4255 domain-containing protein [Acidimicrobiales bacterium]